MTYIYSYIIGSMVFLGTTAYLYFSKNHINNIEDKAFSGIILSSMLALVFDLLSSLGDQYGVFPNGWLYFINIMALASLHFCYPFFCLFLYSAYDKHLMVKKHHIIITFIPYLIILLCLLLSPTSPGAGIFFIDENGTYNRASSYIALFICSAVYYIVALALVLLNFRRTERYKSHLFIACLLLLFVSAALQHMLPEYQLVSSATALSVSVLYLTIQNHADQADPLTGCFSRVQLSKLINYYHKMRISYTLLLFNASFLDRLLISEDLENSTAFISSVSALLREHFPKEILIYDDDMQFVAICRRNVDMQELNSVRKGFSKLLENAAHTETELGIAMLESNESEDDDAILVMLDDLRKRLSAEKPEGILIADDDFRRKCHEDTALTAEIADLLCEERSGIMLRELYDRSGACRGYKAYLVLNSEELGSIYGSNLMKKVDEAGLSIKYLSLLLSRISERLPELPEDCKVEIRVPSMLCFADGAAKVLDEMVINAGISRSRIVLSVKEKNIISTHETVRENLFKSAQLGYTMRVTDFVSGSTNMAMFIRLPVDEIELDVSSDSREQDKMYKAVIGLLKGLDKRVICSGVPDEAHAEAFFEYGADLIAKNA